MQSLDRLKQDDEQSDNQLRAAILNAQNSLWFQVAVWYRTTDGDVKYECFRCDMPAAALETTSRQFTADQQEQYFRALAREEFAKMFDLAKAKEAGDAID